MVRILGGAPAWVYVLLAVLVVLGLRRLRTREVPVAVALIPAVAFTVWSIAGVGSYAAIFGISTAALAWLGGGAVGVATALILPEPRGQRLTNSRVRLPGSAIPLILYTLVFIARFACGAWAAIVPGRAALATGIGIAVGAAMTARLITAIIRWRSPS